MPFFLIPTALGVSFFLIWAFIGGMVFRDSQLAAQREMDADAAMFPLSLPRVTNVVRRPKMQQLKRERRQVRL